MLGSKIEKTRDHKYDSGPQELGIGMTLKRLKEAFGDSGNVFIIAWSSLLHGFTRTLRQTCAVNRIPLYAN